jgi:CRP/FNR family transcriptional regulator, cyclic AMP receptor protein
VGRFVHQKRASDGGRVPLLEVDPELGAALPDEERALAARALIVQTLIVDPGPWDEVPDAGFALLVVEGLVVRETAVGGRLLPQVLGAGDVLESWPEPEGVLAAEVSTTVAEQATLVALDGRFLAAAARWPALMVEVQRRLAMQAHRLAVQGAICQLARVELRVLALLWHLAERWGRVGREGVVLPVKLTHETLGRFVGARRPSVTLAMGQLADEGLIARRDDGAWVLPPRSQEVLADWLGVPQEGPVDWSFALRLRREPPDPARTRS